MSSANLFSTFASGVSSFLAFAVEIALLVIALTSVRARRPEATPPLVVGAVLMLIPTVLWSILTAVASNFMAASDTRIVYPIFTLLSALMRTAGWAAILFGIVKLAGPLSGAPHDPTRFV